MDTPRPRRGGEIASSSFIFLLILIFLCSLFVCDSASEFGAMGSTSFLGFSYPNLLVFSELLFLGTCLYNIFLASSVGIFSGSFLFYFIFLYLILG